MITHHTRAAIAALLGATLVLSACSKTSDTTTEEDATTSASSSSTTAASSTAATTSTSAAAAAAEYPVSVDNCGQEVTLKEQPTRVVTLNQGATELVLALGAGDQMAGTAYLDDEIDPSVKEAYDKIPVLSEKYPSQETFLSVNPDFAVASYSSAFGEKGVGSREELDKLGVETFVDPFACQDKSLRVAPSWEAIYDEITDMGTLLGREDNAATIVADTKSTLADIEKTQPAAGKTFFWYDSGTDEPFVGGNAGGPALIMKSVGAKNIFDSVDSAWGDGSWETVLAANPDYIVLADASWDTAEQKKTYLKDNPSTKDLDAVKNDRFIVVPFAESTPGVHLVDGAAKVAQALKN